MSQFIPPTAFHCVTGTWTLAAGQVAGTIVKIKSANAETSVINIPIIIPSNSVALKGAKLASVEIDYEIRTQAATSITATCNKVTRGADGSDATVTAVAVTQDLTAGTDAADVDEHKLTVTVTTPTWCDNDDYVLLVISAVCAAGTVLEFLGAVANFTLRM
jgi:hypothetical protein